MIRAGGLRGTEATIIFNGRTQVVQLEQEWTFGRKQRLRPWFRCPNCNRRCRTLHEKDGTFVCRSCSGYDYRCRHRNQSCPALNRVLRSSLPACYVLQCETFSGEPSEASDDQLHIR
jgi:hypothetical protein